MSDIKLVKGNKKKSVKVSGPSVLKGVSYSSDSDETVDMERPKKQKKFRKRKQSSSSRNNTFNSNFANLANTRKSLPQQQPDIQEESEYTASESDDISSQYSASVSSKSSRSSRGSRRSRKNKQNFFAQPSSVPTQPYMSSSERDKEKQKMLLKLYEYQTKGVKLSKRFTPESTYEEVKLEYDMQNKMLSNRSAVAFSRKMLMAAVTGLEYMNGRFDPFNIKLDGWSESVMENIGDYDKIFERLAEKYSGRGEMAPELELLFSLAGSAFMFHLTSSFFKSSSGGGIEGMMRGMMNPAMMKGMMGGMNRGTENPNAPGGPQMAGPNFDVGNLMKNIMSQTKDMMNSPNFNIPQQQQQTKPDIQEIPSVPNPMKRPMSTQQASSVVSDGEDRFSIADTNMSDESDIKSVTIADGKGGKKLGRAIKI
tara:strand:+ start:3414 stop:4685 length:1272 start_codon:yes stop_codon:yes gene_type:complete